MSLFQKILQKFNFRLKLRAKFFIIVNRCKQAGNWLKLNSEYLTTKLLWHNLEQHAEKNWAEISAKQHICDFVYIDRVPSIITN